MDKSIRNLPPQERVKALRELHAKKKRELEELEKRRKEELDEAEAAVSQSIEDLAEEEEKEREEQLKSLQQEIEALEEESLEEKLAGQVAEHTQDGYKIPQESQQSYSPITDLVDNLNELSYKNDWSARDKELYTQTKQELEQTEQYKRSMSEDLVGHLDTAKNILERMGYKK